MVILALGVVLQPRLVNNPTPLRSSWASPVLIWRHRGCFGSRSEWWGCSHASSETESLQFQPVRSEKQRDRGRLTVWSHTCFVCISSSRRLLDRAKSKVKTSPDPKSSLRRRPLACATWSGRRKATASTCTAPACDPDSTSAPSTRDRRPTWPGCGGRTGSSR